MTNGKLFDLLPINKLTAIVRNDLRKLDDAGLIDEGTLIKTVQFCNDKLGIPIREIRQKIVPVHEFQANLPLDFEKLYYVCALQATNTSIQHSFKNPFDNSFDRDIIYEADVSREDFGGTPHYNVTINKTTDVEIKTFNNWIELQVSPSSLPFCHTSCPNVRRKGKYMVTIEDDGKVSTPFRSGELYFMYLGSMKDEEGNILFPFHPLITPWYEWCIKEKVLEDALFNSDLGFQETQALYELAGKKRSLAWLDAFNITMESGFNEFIAREKKKELSYYNKYFKLFQ
jgi:ribosomal protein L36